MKRLELDLLRHWAESWRRVAKRCKASGDICDGVAAPEGYRQAPVRRVPCSVMAARAEQAFEAALNRWISEKELAG